MKKNNKDHFLNLNNSFRNVIEHSFSSKHEQRLSELFHLSEDLTTWLNILKETTDTTILYSAIQEYELGFQAVVSGQYRYAFNSQRYFLEQICRFIYLSANELYLRHWKIGLRDFTWGEITDANQGILSKGFVQAFFEELEPERPHLITLLSTLYRESSEFIHGNYSKIHGIPNSINFDNDLLDQWIQFVETCKFVIFFLIFMRFSKDINEESFPLIEDMARENLGEIDGFSLMLLRQG